MSLVPKHWEKFQHYQNRRPPWIKLHRSLLDDCDFINLPIESRALAPMLWLLASESETGEVDAEPSKLAFRLRLTAKEVEKGLDGLVQAGFLFDASTPLAERLHDATHPSNGVSLSVSTSLSLSERESTRGRTTGPKVARPPDVTEQVWEDWCQHRRSKRATVTPTGLATLRKQAESAGMTLEAAMAHTVSQGHQGFFPPTKGSSKTPMIHDVNNIKHGPTGVRPI